MTSYTIEEIEGIGPAYGERLARAEILTTDDLLKKCGDRKGRKAASEASGVGESQLLKWANLADLMRLSGVGRQYSELLEAAGVDTVKELRQRNAGNLADAMSKVNEVKRLAKSTPSQSQVENWIEQAKTTEALITH